MPTTADPFNAIAEPRRREILGLLAAGERPVGEIVESLGIAQPQVSKHLRVLREVGLVTVRDAGRLRYYRLNAEPLRTVHDWTRTFERFWDHQLMRIKQRAEAAAKNAKTPSSEPNDSNEGARPE